MFTLLIGMLIILMGISSVFAAMDHVPLWAIAIKCLQPLVIAGLLMWMKMGSPLNWWSPFFGITMRVNLDKIAVREQAGESSIDVQEEILQWTKTCAKGRSVRINPYVYKFLRKGDAAFFKLAWG